MKVDDLLEITHGYIISELWIYKYYKDVVKCVLDAYRSINKSTATHMHEMCFLVWSQSHNGMYEPPTFKQFCNDMGYL